MCYYSAKYYQADVDRDRTDAQVFDYFQSISCLFNGSTASYNHPLFYSKLDHYSELFINMYDHNSVMITIVGVLFYSTCLSVFYSESVGIRT